MNVRQALPPLLVAAAVCALPAAWAGDSHWAYTGHEGPGHWAQIDEGFATCGLGKAQSPVNIRGAKAADLPALHFDYRPSQLKVIDNGHTIQVNYAPGSGFTVGGKRYDLVQFHFHKPSEEKIGGRSHPMVAHLVHKDSDGKLAVVAVLIDKGGANQVVDAIWSNLPGDKDKEVASSETIDAMALLPATTGYYTFQGSLTTPPCTEDVRWFVLKTPVRIHEGQIADFGKLYPMNARPTQPLNGRPIQATR